MTKITIKELGHIEAEQLSQLIIADDILRKELGFEKQDEHPTPKEFLKETLDWCKYRRATTYAILADNMAIGTITLSHRSLDGLSARVGYWIGSKYRGLGYGTKAFEALLNIAKSKGIEALAGTIYCDNIPSIHIWINHGGIPLYESSGKYEYRLCLDSQ